MMNPYGGVEVMQDGRLGQSTSSSYSDPVQIVSSGAIDVGAGAEHSIILMEDGKILTFGRNNHGQLGTGKHYLSDSAKPA